MAGYIAKRFKVMSLNHHNSMLNQNGSVTKYSKANKQLALTKCYERYMKSERKVTFSFHGKENNTFQF